MCSHGRIRTGRLFNSAALAVANQKLPKDRLVNDPEHRSALVLEGDQGSEQGAGRRERLRAVDRIEDPNKFRIVVFGPVLFADDAVLGKAPADHSAHQFLGSPVGGGDGRLVGLHLHLSPGWAK